MVKIIAVDLDEVLAETFRALLKKKKWKFAGTKISYDDAVSYNLREIPKLNISKKKSVRVYMWFLLWAWLRTKISPVVWAKTKLKEFKKKWYNFHVVTARHFLLRFATGIWLFKNYRHIFDSVVFANFFTRFSTKKSEICKKLWATVIIEDNLDNAIDCAKEWIKVYLLDKPWNQDYDKKIHKWIKKVYSRSEIDI